jgi:hypothetical protein
MNRDEALERIQEVQRIVQRTTMYTLLPGVPAILGGALVLVGCAASYAMMQSLDFQRILWTPLATQVTFCVMWTAIGVGAITLDVVLTARKARQLGLSPAARPARFAAYSLSPSILVAVVLTLQFLVDEQIRYIAPVWMMCYGTGVYTAGLLSVRLPRLLGLAFIALGAVSLSYFPQHGVVMGALSFGLLHILFGVQVLRTARRDAQP